MIFFLNYLSHTCATLFFNGITHTGTGLGINKGENGNTYMEINDYLKFVDDTIQGKDTDMDHMRAPFHKCASFIGK